MRNTRIITALALVLAMLTALAAPCALAEKGVEGRYDDALALMQTGDYAGAASAFADLGNYEDASRLAMYCQAIAAGEAGLYSAAVTNLSTLGDFRDAALRAKYYAALSYEVAENYEKAAELLSGMEFFGDVAQRLIGYPEKINARDYAAADADEQAGRLEDALEGFKALRTYRDSAERAEAVQQKIYARDYAAADAAEQADRLEEALEGFKALGNYEDSAERAEAVQEKINARDYAAADAAEQRGDYETALAGFTALGDYADSAQRAAAVRDKGNYALGLRQAMDGRFKEAYRTFKALGDYEDSAEKTYVLGVTDFADRINDKGKGIAAFRFHDLWGVINVSDNTTASPYWESIGSYNGLGLAQVAKGSWFGYIDARGNVVVPCEYAAVSDFRGKLCMVASKSYDNYLFGLVDSDGNIVSEPQWRTLGTSKNYAWDKTYNNVSIYAPVFSDGKIKVQDEDGLWGFIDESGELVGEVRWTEIQDFSENLAVVCENGQYGFIDRDGKVVIEPQYLAARSFHEGLAAVQTSDGWQYIDPENRVVIPPLYREAEDFHGGRADVFLPGTGWQIIDKTGGLVYFITNDIKAAYRDGVSLMESGDYDGAIEVLAALNGYGDSEELILECRYRKAMAMLDAGEFDESLQILGELGDYRDAAQQLTVGRYRKATALMEAGDYSAAAEAFSEIPDYSDAADLALECQYRNAAALRDEGNLAAALAVFTALGDYRDAVDQAAEITEQIGEAAAQAELEWNAKLAGLQQGDSITFGSYDQDGTEDNGAEPIEWIVLSADDNSALLISRYALECKKYNEENTSINWATCTLRNWMNGEFYGSAFTEDEKARILRVKVKADKNPATDVDPGKDTQDKVFALSVNEATRYFASPEERIVKPTLTAVNNGAYKNDAGNGTWWLRTPGQSKACAAGVALSGDFSINWGVHAYDCGVRPAIVLSKLGPAEAMAAALPANSWTERSEAELVALAAEALKEPEYYSGYEALLAEGPVSQGSKGEAAKAVQRLLIGFGQSITADGDAGARTMAALNEVQASLGLEETASIDASIYARLLLQLLACSDPESAAAMQADCHAYGTDEDYREAQERASALRGI